MILLAGWGIHVYGTIKDIQTFDNGVLLSIAVKSQSSCIVFGKNYDEEADMQRFFSWSQIWQLALMANFLHSMLPEVREVHGCLLDLSKPFVTEQLL